MDELTTWDAMVEKIVLLLESVAEKVQAAASEDEE